MPQLTFKTGGPTQAPGQSDAGSLTPKRGVVSVPGQESARAEKRAREEQRAERQANSVFGSAEQKDFGPDYGYRRIRLHKKDEVNPYADAQDERFGFDPRATKLMMLAVALLIIFFLVCILPTNVFDPIARTDHTIGTFASEIAQSFTSMLRFFTNPNSFFGVHVFTVLVTVLAGAAMAISGGVFQGAMKNALASPSTLGVTNGGALGAIIFAVFVAPESISSSFQGSIADYSAQIAQLDTWGYICEMYGSFFSSLLGCVIVVFLVMLIALIAGRGKVSNASLVIAGQVFAAAITLVISWIRTYLTMNGDETTLRLLQNASSSTFQGSYNVISIAVFAIPLIICMVVIVLMSGRLTLLAFNDEEARSMGISTVRTRNVMVAVCTIMTALVVSFCGVVGFVGFLVPHLARKVVGPDFRYLLPASGLIGACMVCLTYYISELGIPGLISGSTGMITSVVGCIAFLVMALRKRGQASGDWL